MRHTLAGTVPRTPLGRVGIRVAAPTALLLIVALSSLAYLQWRETSRRANETLDRYALLLNRLVLSNLRGAMVTKQRGQVQRELAEIAGLPPIRAVRIVAKSGEVKFSSDPAQVGKTLARSDPSCLACHGRPGWEPGPGAATVRFNDHDGTTIFRAVEPIVVEPSCRPCHKAATGEILGILMTDIDDQVLTGGLRTHGARSVGLLLLAAIVVLGALGLGVHTIVVRRLRDLRHLMDLLRGGARSGALTLHSRDEIDDLARSLQALALDFQDRLVVSRTAGRIGVVLERHQGPALLLDAEGRVIVANRHAAALHDGTSIPAGMSRSRLSAEPRDAWDRAREAGWALASDASGPVVVRLCTPQDEPVGFLETWPEDPNATTAGADSSVKTDTVWQTYAAVIVEQISANSTRFRGVVDLDRRLALARRVTSELLRVADEIRSEREEIDLGALGTVVLWDQQREAPDVDWHALLTPPVGVDGQRCQLRMLIERLARAAVRQAGPKSTTLLFTQIDSSKSKAFVGAWAARPGARGGVDAVDGPPLAVSIAHAHGGGVEIDPEFDVRGLVEARGPRFSGTTVGSLFVAELSMSRSMGDRSRQRRS